MHPSAVSNLRILTNAFSVVFKIVNMFTSISRLIRAHGKAKTLGFIRLNGTEGKTTLI